MNRLNCSDIHRILCLPLGKKIDQQAIEQWAASFWDVSRHKPITGDSFVMLFPPPNITGNLHLGHALTAAVQDALIRQRQMQGKQAIWIPGFDHAGLATQNIVEKLLWRKQNISRQKLGKNKFNQLANEWKDLKRTEMKGQLDRLGLALDYENEYFTMDENSSLAVNAAFKKLYKKGIIYRDVKLVFWSNQLETTLSDIEVEKVDGIDKYIRTGEIVERRPLSQWFVNAKDMARRSVEVVENCSIDIIPHNYKRSWSSWLIENGVHDWCISRQSWWGHRIPAYKLESATDIQNNWIVADSHVEAVEQLGSYENVIQDPDVLDTWFSSSLLPLTISGWPNPNKFAESHKKGLFPLDILETGFDILNYWVSKMVMMSLALEGEIPFKLILLHGMICDSGGKKMSKSKGNVIDPLDVIDGASLKDLQQRTKDLHANGIMEESQLDSVLHNQKKLFPHGIPSCGADGLRAYLLSHDIQEEIVRVQIDQIEKVRRLSNKIWNIFRFVIQIIDSQENYNLELDFDLENIDEAYLCTFDQQVLRELSRCVSLAHKSFGRTYQLQHCFNNLELFWTVHLSTNYIESIKPILFGIRGTDEARKLKLQILIKCLVNSTKLLHPFMPHITEYLYQKLSVSVKRFEIDMDKIGEIQALRLESYPKIEEWAKYLSKLQDLKN